MKSLLILGVLMSALVQAQTDFEKKVPVQAGQPLHMVFEHPELIRIQTWESDHILVKGSVSINKGESDEAFQLKVDKSGNALTITSYLEDEENIPRRIVIRQDDTDYYFPTSDRNDPEVKKFLDAHDGKYTYMTTGIIKEIRLDIFVPVNTTTLIEAKFGMVEVKDFKAPLIVNSKFGGVDASLATSRVGHLKASTRFGEILSNLDITFDTNKQEDTHDHWTIITATAGHGPDYEFESKFGKVYLRKAE